ncbi:hypothetical protein [Streptomyces sp. NPDC051162]|uniref:hypothetical protein n=1 Tax=Streptomyces sp. NPDC051162 TaxID=3154747 RepID=UPI0034372306
MTTASLTAQPAIGQPEPVEYHWIMTVQTDDGMQGTYDGSIGAVPGIHTRTSTYKSVRKLLVGQMGTDRFVVLFYDAQPDHL